MALVTRTLSNIGSPLVSPNGTPLANVKIDFVLTPAATTGGDVFDALTGERVTGTTSALTNAAGEFTVQLWPNDRGAIATQYLCRVANPTVKDFKASVPSGPTTLSWVAFMAQGAVLTPAQIAELEHVANKDASNGYVGLTLFKINFMNALGTFKSFFTNSNTAARTYTFQDRDGTIADNTDILSREAAANKDASNGYVGLTLFKLNLKNASNTFTNFLTNATTGVRTWTMPDKDGTVAMTNDKLSAFAATSSAELGGVLSDETGTGQVVFNTSPRIDTPTIHHTVSPSIAAAGATQATATAIASARCKITTSTAGSGVILPTPAAAGLDVWIDNDTANAVNLYPQVGGQIDVLGANNPLIIPAGGSVLVSAASTIAWDSYLSNDPAFRDVTASSISTSGSGTGVQIANINTTTAQNEQVAGSNSANLAAVRAILINTTLSGGATTTQLSGFHAQCVYTPAVAGLSEYGGLTVVTHNSANVPSGVFGNYANITLGAAALGGTIPAATVFVASVPSINASTTTNITEYRGFYAASITQGALQTISTVYGFRCAQTAGTNRWACYMDGAANNAFAGNVRFGSVATPTAHIHSAAGGAAAGSAPVLIDSGTLTTTPVAGQFEYNNTWYMTDSAGVRRQIGSTNYAAAESAITPPASTVSYQNATGYDADVLITGGTVTLIEFSRNGTTWYSIGAAVSGFVRLSPFDRVRVTYTVSPTMTLIPR